ncbi:MAG: hypothetical protein VX499_00010 [Bacteroidota bacterium]|nr:hypothetical protein [Bacteroidota bacterium]
MIKTLFIEDIKITIFDFDLKYVIKFEKNRLEQTFKLDKLEFSELDDLERKINSDIIKSIKNRFSNMTSDLKKFYK